MGKGLEEIFGRFHGELDSYLNDEENKLKKIDTRGKAARDGLERCAGRVNKFLSRHAPDRYSDPGPDPSGASFTAQALPKFLEIVAEDHRAMQEAVKQLAIVADRFPKNEELAGLKDDSSPLPLLQALLPLLARGTADETAADAELPEEEQPKQRKQKSSKKEGR